jgi:hypothetical protein
MPLYLPTTHSQVIPHPGNSATPSLAKPRCLVVPRHTRFMAERCCRDSGATWLQTIVVLHYRRSAQRSNMIMAWPSTRGRYTRAYSPSMVTSSGVRSGAR